MIPKSSSTKPVKTLILIGIPRPQLTGKSSAQGFGYRFAGPEIWSRAPGIIHVTLLRRCQPSECCRMKMIRHRHDQTRPDVLPKAPQDRAKGQEANHRPWTTATAGPEFVEKMEPL